MKELSLHLMDIMQNSIEAESTRVDVTIRLNKDNSCLSIIVEDNGRGMDNETLECSTDPFHTSRSTRKIGLGIPMFKESAELTGGSFEIRSQEGKGTRVQGDFVNGSIDRQPLGDVGNVFFLNMISYEAIVFALNLETGKGKFEFDSCAYGERAEMQGKDAMSLAFEAEDLINNRVRELFGELLPELGGDLSGIKGSSKTY